MGSQKTEPVRLRVLRQSPLLQLPDSAVIFTFPLDQKTKGRSVDWVDEPVSGYPRRPVPRDEDAAKALKKRTLTNLYNARRQWLLIDAHDALDAAVAAPYGWHVDISDDDALRELLVLNGGGG